MSVYYFLIIFVLVYTCGEWQKALQLHITEHTEVPLLLSALTC